jgi:solute:Na+ symporter, SSS family
MMQLCFYIIVVVAGMWDETNFRSTCYEGKLIRAFALSSCVIISCSREAMILISMFFLIVFLAFCLYLSVQLTAHYLGGRDFGPLLTAGTLFASLFSGFTVVGIPNEAYKFGFYSMRWIASTVFVCVGYYATGLRLRKASLFRNHQSPVDFITDRFQSQFLRYTLLALQVLPTIVYLAGQVIAIKNNFNSIFELDPDTAYPVIVVMIVILIFEWVGGLSSVALTDAFQAVVMIFAFIATPLVIVKHFGGWGDFNPLTFPKPQLYQTLSIEQQWSFWEFSLVNFSFFTLPHLVQRIYAARDLRSLKTGFAILTAGPWFASFVSIYMGTVGIKILGGAAVPNPIASILEEVMNLGGFPYIMAVIYFTASLAAIMSTADSLMIAISQLITVEIVYPLRPQGTPAEMAFVGKFVSIVTVVLSLLLGIYWDEGLTDLFKVQTPLSAQAVPAFLIGLYSYRRSWEIHPWSIAISAIMATAYVITFYFGYLKGKTGAKGVDAGITGFMVQLFLIAVCEFVRRLVCLGSKKQPKSQRSVQDSKASSGYTFMFPQRPSWDVPKLRRFGEHALTPELLWKSMEGMYEPITNPWWMFTMFFSITMATPWTDSLQPGIDTSDGGSAFFTPPATVGGLPWWAFKTILLCVIPSLLLLFTILMTPDEFPIDEVAIGTKGIDPDLVELTPKEMGGRTAYDEVNSSIRLRRSSILNTMEELGIKDIKVPNASEIHLTPLQVMLKGLALEASRPFDMNDKTEVIKEKSEEDIEEVSNTA